MYEFMQYIYLFLLLCAIIIVIAFPIINTAKKRNQTNMHMFNNMPESKEQQKKQSIGVVMESVVVVAIVYLVMFFIQIVKDMIIVHKVDDGYPFFIIRGTAIVSIIVLVIKWLRRKKSQKEKKINKDKE